MRRPTRASQDWVALVMAATICLVLLAVTLDMMIAAQLSPADRAASLAALGAIGLALAHGLGRWIAGDDDDERDH